MATYKTAPFKCWEKAKELRQNYYKRFAEIKDITDGKGFRWGGGSWTFDALVKGVDEGDFAHITSEPYAASISWDSKFSVECLEACEKYGHPRDLCSYMRNYWGSMYLNRYAFGGPMPKLDFALAQQICCAHTKWYQHVAEYEGIPLCGIDIAVGPYEEITPNRIDYVANQCYDAIDFLEKVTGREFNVERFIEAVYEECRIASLWAEICLLNQTKPAQMEEKTMYSFYVLACLDKCSKEIGDFYEELLAEMRDRVAQGIGAIPEERCRLITDTQPPWAFLSLFRYLEGLGTVSVGSLYTFGLKGIFDYERDAQGQLHMVPAKTPQQKEIEIKDLDQALHIYADWNLRRPLYGAFYTPKYKTELMASIYRDWNLDGVILHYNRGCEGLSLNIAEVRLGLIAKGIPVMTFEGNCGDPREFDEASTKTRVNTFLESMGVIKSA